MTATHKHPSAAFWITVALVALLVGYPLSFGPACWVVSRAGIYDNRLSTIYRPVVSCLSHKPGPCGSLIEQYAGLVAADGWRWGDVGDGQWVYADFAPIAPF